MSEWPVTYVQRIHAPFLFLKEGYTMELALMGFEVSVLNLFDANINSIYFTHRAA